jgi:hypothetical protein
MIELSIQPGLYRHYKGGLYQVLHIAQHSETEEQLVVYRSLSQGGVWVRPAAMFLEQVNGRPRFERMPQMEVATREDVCPACNGAGLVAAERVARVPDHRPPPD